MDNMRKAIRFTGSNARAVLDFALKDGCPKNQLDDEVFMIDGPEMGGVPFYPISVLPGDWVVQFENNRIEPMRDETFLRIFPNAAGEIIKIPNR